MSQSSTLQRGLNTRHIRFLALGSAIGTGLFYGSATAIKMAGPSVLLAYIVAGIAIYIVMRALGEMAVQNPVSPKVLLFLILMQLITSIVLVAVIYFK